MELVLLLPSTKCVWGYTEDIRSTSVVVGPASHTTTTADLPSVFSSSLVSHLPTYLPTFVEEHTNELHVAGLDWLEQRRRSQPVVG